MTKPFNPVVPIKRNRRPTPQDVKLQVLQSQRLNKYLDDTSENKNERQKKVFEVLQILSEIAFDRKTLVLRCLGTVIGKLMTQLYSSVYVNETSLNNLKSTFGSQQVIYLPSHRSYADFMLMSFICFSYNLEVPAIAAGMDFHGMMGLGEMMRKTGAFFMRRTFGGDESYWRVFKEYMREIIVFNDLGLEFFIEGTRSRSCKALTPKLGLLSMALEPYFMGEVHDLTIVPVSVSYEKPLEEQLFVYELLGIPKPKESTMGFLKAVANLKNQNLGRIYFDFGEPMSLNQYASTNQRADRFKHSSEPAFVQTLTTDDTLSITDLAYEVVRRQQHKIVLMSFNLIALAYNQRIFTRSADSLTFEELKNDVLELMKLFEYLGAIVAINLDDLTRDFLDTIFVHRNILEVTGNNSNVRMIKSSISLNEVNSTKLKGARLHNEVMNIAVPTFSLQLYCNSTLYWLAQPAFFVLSALSHDDIEMVRLRQDVETLRKIFIYEFVLYPGLADEDFDRVNLQMNSLEIFNTSSSGTVCLNKSSEHVNRLLSAIAPFINCYFHASRIILDKFEGKDFVEKDVFVAVQSSLEAEILEGSCDVHPYALCLDSITMVILSLCNYGCLFKQKQLSQSAFNFERALTFFLQFQKHNQSLHNQRWKFI